MNETHVLADAGTWVFLIKKIVDKYIVLRYSDYIEVRYIVVRWCRVYLLERCQNGCSY